MLGVLKFKEMTSVRILQFFFLMSTLNVAITLGDRIVVTNVGAIRGSSATDGNYTMFLGIPYGKVDDPFGISKPYPAFDGIFDANDDSVICPQIYQFNSTYAGDINCLNLNIYVPYSASATNQLPVLVWIHGGHFRGGFGAKRFYGPKYLVRHDVILITLNYRLGAYGFMCLDIPEVSGNQGLKDQVLAFRWIRDNIRYFGGNPEQVTLFGGSAGAHSIDLHLLSQNEKLYNKVIMQSGSSLARTVLVEPDRAAPMKIADHLGFNPSNTYEALSSLANVAPSAVIAAVAQLDIDFRPCVEKGYENTEQFITKNWIHADVPKIEGIPVLLGFNEYERMLAHLDGDAAHFDSLDIFSRYLNQTFDFDDERFNRMERIVRNFYIGDDAISAAVQWSIINFDSDYTYIYPMQRSIRKYIEAGAGNIYYYMFSYSGGVNYAKVLANVTANGTAHADDLSYLFDISYIDVEPSAEDQIMIDRMTTMWTNFAKYSDPTPETTQLLPIRWTPLTSTSYHYLKIDSELSMEGRPFNRRMGLWDLFYKLNNKLQRVFEDVEEVDDGSNGGSIGVASLVNIVFSVLIFFYRINC